jgi:hypothetical protein
MAERRKKSSWVFPSAGPGTFSGFFVAWVFVAGIIGLALILMAIGRGPLPLRVVAYDISLEGIAPGEVETILAQTTPWVERAGAGSSVLREVMAGKLYPSKAAEKLKIEEQEVNRLIREPRVVAEKVMRGELTSKEGARRLGVNTEEMESYAAAEQGRLATAVRQTNPMVLVLQGTSEKLTSELSRMLELKYVLSDGDSATLSKYAVVSEVYLETSRRLEGYLHNLAQVRFGKIALFGVVNVDAVPLRNRPLPPDLKEGADHAAEEFGKTPHAIFVSASGSPPGAPSGYIKAAAENESESDWHMFIPEAIQDNLKECYVPAENEKITDFSGRLPLVARFVFGKKDFE